jgi:hypothetical protein
MSILPHFFGWAEKTVGLKQSGKSLEHALDPKIPPPPGVPNPNDAANAAQSQTDSMRMRRGLLANMYAGQLNQQPVTGKTQLGS